MEKKEKKTLHEKAALIALHALITRHGDWSLSKENELNMLAEDFYAKRAVEFANSLVREIERETSDKNRT